MSSNVDMQRIADELALRRLAERYAIAVDSVQGDEFAQVFVPDGVLESPTGTFVGRAALSDIPRQVRGRYTKTFHAVLNQLASIRGDEAEAQTYCIARHLFEPRPGETLCYEMTIRYQDQFCRLQGDWYFTRRRLIVDWMQTLPVRVPPNPT